MMYTRTVVGTCLFGPGEIKETLRLCMYVHARIVPYSGKFLRVQTFAKMPPEAPEEIFAVLIFATKPCIVRYQLGC